MLCCNIKLKTCMVSGSEWEFYDFVRHPSQQSSCGVGTQFTDGYWAHNWNVMKIFISIIIHMMQSGHNVAHAMTAKLSWHVPYCDLIIAVHVKSNTYLFKDLDYGLIYHLWNGSTVNFLQSTHNGHPHISTMRAKHYVSLSAEGIILMG